MSLLQHHLEMLHESGIPDEVIRQRGYFSCSKKSELAAFGFSTTQLRTVSTDHPALVIPVFQAGRAEAAFHVLRPDRPRVTEDLKSAKYEMPRGKQMVLDVPPMAREWIGDPQRALYITEGTKKADAGVGHGLCVVDLLGVWNYRGTNQYGGRTALGDWEYVALNNQRPVYIVFDSDVVFKRQVHAALLRLKALLEARGAENVRVIYLPPDDKGGKTGLDDYLRNVKRGQAQYQLHLLSSPEIRAFPEDEEDPRHGQSSSEYQYAPGGMYWLKATTDQGQQRLQMANFQVRILSDVLLDDGTDDRVRALEIEGFLDADSHLNGRAVRRGLVKSREFEGLTWVPEFFGARGIIWPGQGIRERLRHAIQVLSGDIEERVSYTHLGWRKLDDRWVYLHSGGAIGAEGSIDGVRADVERLERYQLPDPVDGEDAKEAVRRSLRFLDIAERSMTWPVLAAMYTAPLANLLPTNFVLWVHGETGGKKSSAVALALCHFGQFRSSDLWINFGSSANSVEAALFHAKDTCAVVDDYNPAADRKTQEKMDMVADRLLSSVGDWRGRGRMNADSSLKRVFSPRCLALATAEAPPPGQQSRAARAFETEWFKALVRDDELTRAQREDPPFYAQAMAGYLQFLAPQLDRLAGVLPDQVRQMALRMPPAHGRIQESAAKLWVGVSGFLTYAEQVGAIDRAARVRLSGEALSVFQRLAGQTGAHEQERKPAVLFVDYLRALIIRGQAYVADRKTGYCPDGECGFWGYAPARGNETDPQPRPSAVKLGWVDLERRELCLESTVTHEAVLAYSQRAGLMISPTKRGMGTALDREGLLVRKYPGRSECNIRAEGAKQWCWVLSLDVLNPVSANDPEEDDGPFVPESADGEPPADPGAGAGSSCASAPARTSEAAENARCDPNTGTPPWVSGGSVILEADSSEGTVQEDSPEEFTANCEEHGQKNLPPELPPESDQKTDSGGTSGVVPPDLENASRAVEAKTAVRPATVSHERPVKTASASRITPASSFLPTPSWDRDACTLLSAADLPAAAEVLARTPVVGIDLETTGLNPRRDRIRLVSLATPERVYLVDAFELDPRPLFPVLAERHLVGHNLNFDLRFLWEAGFRCGRVECTMLNAQLLGASGARPPKGTYSLGRVAETTVGIELDKSLQRSDWSGRLTAGQLEYAARDAWALLPLQSRQRELLHEAGLDTAAEIERRCLPGMVWMGAIGVPFDGEGWLSLALEAEAEQAEVLAALDVAAPMPPEAQLGLEGLAEDGIRRGWHWDSPEIVKRVFRELGLELEGTRDDELAKLEHPVADLLRGYRGCTTRTGRYGRSWLARIEGGRIYPDWLQLGSRAGRMSCEDPTVQNLPRDLRYRRCFMAPAGRVLVKADYSQIELRITAKITGDRVMSTAYLQGGDLHTLTAQQLLGDTSKAARQVAKPINFGLIYGMGAAGLRASAQSGYGVEMTLAQAERYRAAFFRAYAGVAQWHRSQPKEALETRTLTGRRRLDVTWFTQKVNSPVQGTGADGLKRALALLWERRGEHPTAVPVIACHDELVMECDADEAPAVEAWLRKAMIDGMEPLTHPVPCEVETQIGPTWAG